MRQSHAALHLLYGHSSHPSLCSYVIFGAVGVVVAVIVGLTVRVKQESRARSLRVSVPDESQRSASTARLSVSELVRYWLFSPTLILLYVVLSVACASVHPVSRLTLTLSPLTQRRCFGGGIRNAGGYVWASYTPVFFRYRGVPDELFAAYMLWIPLVAGSLVKIDTARVVTRRVWKRATSASTANGSSLTIPCMCTTLWLCAGSHVWRHRVGQTRQAQGQERQQAGTAWAPAGDHRQQPSGGTVRCWGVAAASSNCWYAVSLLKCRSHCSLAAHVCLPSTLLVRYQLTSSLGRS